MVKEFGQGEPSGTPVCYRTGVFFHGPIRNFAPGLRRPGPVYREISWAPAPLHSNMRPEIPPGQNAPGGRAIYSRNIFMWPA